MEQEEARIKRAFCQFIEKALIERDLEKSLEVVSEDVLGIGMGDQGMVACREDVRRILEAEKIQPGAVYSIQYEKIFVRYYPPGFGTICGVIKVICELPEKGESSVSRIIQFASARKEGERWLLCALQASPVEVTEESIDAYPLQFAENTLAHLRSELQSETFELVTKSVCGGILGTYIRDKQYPLYFINDSMLDYLGYTREEFINTYRDDVFQIIHPEDQGLVRSIMESSLGGDFQAKFRVKKKNGGYLWMMERGRKNMDEQGRPIYLGVFMDISEMVQLQEELQEQATALAVSEERFRIALEKTSNIIFDYDVISGNIMHSSVPKKSLEFVTNVRQARNTLIIGGTVLPESEYGFNRAFQLIQEGAPHSECVVKVRLASGIEVWNKISMTAITDDTGKTARAIGMIEDITRQKETELAYAREEQYRKAILSNTMASYVVNFTKGIFESCTIRDSRCMAVQPGESYDGFLESAARQRMNDTDRRAYLDLFSKRNILEAFEKGITEQNLEYHTINLDGTDMWMQTTMRLFLDVGTNEQKGFLYVTDIDQRKRTELELKERSQRDPLTGLLNKSATENRIRELLKTREGIESGVFMMIDMDHFKAINDTFGHPYGDKILMKGAKGIQGIFRENDIVGRLGGDEFCVFFCGIRSKKRIEEAAQSICTIFHNLFVPGPEGPAPSCSIGIARCEGVLKDFEQLYAEADAALYQVKKSGRDSFAFA